MDVTTERSKVETCNEELPSIKSQQPLITWKIIFLISLLSQGLRPLNFGKKVTHSGKLPSMK